MNDERGPHLVSMTLVGHDEQGELHELVFECAGKTMRTVGRIKEWRHGRGEKSATILPVDETSWPTAPADSEFAARIKLGLAEPEPVGSVWAVQFSNYYPAEIHSLHATKASAVAECEIMNRDGSSMWIVVEMGVEP